MIFVFSLHLAWFRDGARLASCSELTLGTIAAIMRAT